jgi:hypothetical protein
MDELNQMAKQALSSDDLEVLERTAFVLTNAGRYDMATVLQNRASQLRAEQVASTAFPKEA